MCTCGRGPTVGFVDGRRLDLCVWCLLSLEGEAAEQRAPGSWDETRCLCGAPLALDATLCAACEGRAHDERDMVARRAVHRLTLGACSRVAARRGAA